jgi:hypothetical protein
MGSLAVVVFDVTAIVNALGLLAFEVVAMTISVAFALALMCS